MWQYRYVVSLVLGRVMNFVKKGSPSAQQGFVGIVFLAIALIGIVIAAIAAMSRSSSSGAADQSVRTNVAVLLKQASDFKNGFDRMIISGVPASSVTFDTTAGSGLFDPTPGAQYSVNHKAPGALFMPSATVSYYYSTFIQVPDIGSPAAPDAVVTAGPITLLACQSINKILYNDLITGSPATSSGSLSAWTSLPSAIDDSTSSAVNYSGRPEGCVATSDGSYVYYKVLMEN
jgi:hypothetical protein